MHSAVWGVSTWSEKASDARSMAGYSGTSTADEAEAVEGTTGVVFLVEVVIVPLPPPLPPPAVVVVLVVASDVPGWTGGGRGGAPVEERAAPTRAATMGK